MLISDIGPFQILKSFIFLIKDIINIYFLYCLRQQFFCPNHILLIFSSEPPPNPCPSNIISFSVLPASFSVLPASRLETSTLYCAHYTCPFVGPQQLGLALPASAEMSETPILPLQYLTSIPT